MGENQGAPADLSNGYEEAAQAFMRLRGASDIGVATVRKWASTLPPGASVLDLGCGDGVPLAKALIDDGFSVFGIDASPTLTAAFQSRFPRAKVRCEAVGTSDFFDRTFDGVLAVGLMFLLDAEAQRDLIRDVANALTPGGRFLFTAPKQPCEWTDVLTGRRSVSLGARHYRDLLKASNLAISAQYSDAGGNHYFDALLCE
jgi:SAM-dependent methyltransferase